MTSQEDAFRHVPALRDRITPMAQSQVRLSYARFEELDAQALEENWPPDWRMDHAARERNRHEVLDGRLDQDLWVFAYGSLIWDPALHFSEIRRARLTGWSRKFCMRLTGGRGTPERPGLMAALDHGGHCEAVAFRIPAELVDHETEVLWMREMFTGSYHPCFMPVETPQGPVQALAFVMDHDNERYEPDLSEKDKARIIATAEGGLGPNFDYLASLALHLTDLGIDDPYIVGLHKQCCALRNTRALD